MNSHVLLITSGYPRDMENFNLHRLSNNSLAIALQSALRLYGKDSGQVKRLEAILKARAATDKRLYGR